MTTYNTGNPIGSSDPHDLYDNAENLDALVNDKTKGAHTDRLGVERKTWHGIEQDFELFMNSSNESFQQFLLSSGYQDLGDYKAGLEITARNQAFRKDGELYRAGAALNFPYTTTGDWLVEGELFVVVGDGALRQQLGNASDSLKGAALIGYRQGTVADALNALPESIDKYPTLVSALNSGRSSFSVPPGVHVVEGGVITSQNITSITGAGPDSVLDFSGSDEGLRFESDIVQIPNPLSTPAFGGTFISFPAGLDIQRNDVIVFFNPTSESFSSAREYYKDGFMVEVSEYNSVTGKANFFGMFPDANLSAMETYRIRSRPLEISNIKIIPPKSGAALFIYGKSDVRLLNIKGDRGLYETFIDIDRCFNVTIRDVGGDSLVDNGYVLMIGNTQKFVIDNASGHSHRHCIALGGRSGPATVPYRDGVITNCILESDSRTGVAASDMHGNGVNVNYVDCIIKSGAFIGGRDVGYHNCDIYSRAIDNDGNAIYGGECVGGTYTVNNCRLYISRAEPKLYSVIHFNLLHLKRDVFINIVNTTIYNNSVAVTPRSIVEAQVNTSANGKKVWINIDGIFALGSDFPAQQIVQIRHRDGAGGTTSGMDARIAISNESASAVLYASTANIDPEQVKYRLPSQSGFVSVFTKAASDNSLTTKEVVSFDRQYPKTPSVQVTNSSANIMAGGSSTIPHAIPELDKVTIYGAAGTGASYPNTEVVNLSWVAFLTEF